ncbi:MAG: hypothetical protein ACPGVB_15520 [Chitinophagales bacterium]
MNKLLIFCLSLFFAACENNHKPTVSKEQLKTYQEQEAAIENYLISEIGVVGFEGTVYCVDSLLGVGEDAFYLYVFCQEYYSSYGKSEKGTGVIMPIKLLVKNDVIVGHENPEDGSRYTKDIERIFPKPIAKNIQNNPLNTDLLQKMKLKLGSKKG